MQFTLVPLGPWIKYARLSDNIKVSARLVERTDTVDEKEAMMKMLEVKEDRMSEFTCPSCKYLITQRDARTFPNLFLEPKIFHAAYKLVDPVK